MKIIFQILFYIDHANIYVFLITFRTAKKIPFFFKFDIASFDRAPSYSFIVLILKLLILISEYPIYLTNMHQTIICTFIIFYWNWSLYQNYNLFELKFDWICRCYEYCAKSVFLAAQLFFAILRIVISYWLIGELKMKIGKHYFKKTNNK